MVVYSDTRNMWVRVCASAMSALQSTLTSSETVAVKGGERQDVAALMCVCAHCDTIDGMAIRVRRSRARGTRSPLPQAAETRWLDAGTMGGPSLSRWQTGCEGTRTNIHKVSLSPLLLLTDCTEPFRGSAAVPSKDPPAYMPRASDQSVRGE